MTNSPRPEYWRRALDERRLVAGATAPTLRMQDAGAVRVDAGRRSGGRPSTGSGRGGGAPGCTTAELDEAAAAVIADAGAKPASWATTGTPRRCVSVNDEVVHGIRRTRASHRRPGVDRLRCHRRRLARRCGADGERRYSGRCRCSAVGGDARIALGRDRRRPSGGRGSAMWATRWSRSCAIPNPGMASWPATPGTASARPCIWTRTCPTVASPDVDRRCTPAWRSPSNRWSPPVGTTRTSSMTAGRW